MSAHLLIQAMQLAEQAHRGQMYGLAPYIFHPLAVAELVAFGGGCTDEQVAAALLHDTIEDTWVDHADIAECVSPAVADLVQSLAHAPDVPYEQYVDALPDDAVLVKWADSMCNLRGLRSALMAPARKAKLTARYERNLAVLGARLDPEPPPAPSPLEQT